MLTNNVRSESVHLYLSKYLSICCCCCCLFVCFLFCFLTKEPEIPSKTKYHAKIPKSKTMLPQPTFLSHILPVTHPDDHLKELFRLKCRKKKQVVDCWGAILISGRPWTNWVNPKRESSTLVIKSLFSASVLHPPTTHSPLPSRSQIRFLAHEAKQRAAELSNIWSWWGPLLCLVA